MMDKKQIGELKLVFDEISHTNENGIEYWLARELQFALGYQKWDNFLNVVTKAKISCQGSANEVANHFAEVGKLIDTAKTAQRDIGDIMLTRYACYLVAQNGDSKKAEIAFAQSYFALQTRKQELIEDRLNLLSRMEARDRLKESEKQLSKNIYERGVDDAGFSRIRSKGDTALFGGHSTKEMKQKLDIKEDRPLADFLPTLTIAAKNLANEMTNHNVEGKNLHGESPITAEHIQNNSSVRETLTKRGIRPENLPPSEDIKKLERRVKSEEKKLAKDAGKFPI